jgi:hypothetical protein
MPIHSADITVVFEEAADRPGTRGAARFCIRACRFATRALGPGPIAASLRGPT